MTPDPNYDESVKFLQRWCPGGPWVLTAISLDKKGIETRTFRDTTMVLEWLKKHGAERNIYFSVNPCKNDVNKKPMREDVKSLSWLHVDIDPRAGEDLTAERQRALSILQTPPNGIPKPTVIVFSGGGYQGFWKLQEPKEIDGIEALFEDAKRYNQALELAFGADNCHNVDRIMRLPGTINRPDARKKKKGRSEALAEVIEWDDNRVYPLSQFSQAPTVQLDTTGFSHSTKIQVSGNIQRINDVNDLAGVSDLGKIVIVQGHDPDTPDRFPSRSEALFFACCDMVRADLDNDTIFSVITDPEFGISASVLDKGRNAEGYAKKQIERARLRAIDPALMEMNDKYAVVLKPKACVMSWVPDEIDPSRQKLILQSFEDIRNGFLNRKVQIGTDAQGNPRYCPLGKWWLEHEKRRQYEGIVFRPKGDLPDHYNLWQGFGVEPKPGDWSPMKQHVTEVLASGNADWAEYIIRWCAWTVQNPGRMAEVALVLRGEEGTGKGIFGRTLCRLFGQHALHIGSSGLLNGRFTGHLRDCVLLFADEAVAPNDKEAAGRLKKYITEPTLDIEGKNKDACMAPNFLHIIMSSNNEWVANASLEDRRYAAFDVAGVHIRDEPYWDALYQWAAGDGPAAMLDHLLRMDLGKWHPRWNIPQTEALARQKAYSLPAAKQFVYEALCDGQMPNHGVEGRRIRVLTLKLYDSLPEKLQASFKRRGLGNQLALIGDYVKGTNSGPDGWLLLPLDEARRKFRTDNPGLPPFPDEPDDWAGVEGPSWPDEGTSNNG